MASGWANDGAVQDQIDATVDDAVARARSQLSHGESAHFCEECCLGCNSALIVRLKLIRKCRPTAAITAAAVKTVS